MESCLEAIAQQLTQSDQILIISHKNPDGDTLGSAGGLFYALKQLGKQAAIICSDPIPKRFLYLFEEAQQFVLDFKPQLIVSVDVADVTLLGPKTQEFANRIDICIDHHKSNGVIAKQSYIEVEAAATCEIIYLLLKQMSVQIDRKIANCLYTGICTDTGCFKFSNTTPRTHRIAAALFESGCEYEQINRRLFDIKSMEYMMVKRDALEHLEFYYDKRVALIVISQALLQKIQVDVAELDGISAIPRQIEGVDIGIILKERPEGGYKVSIRTGATVDASELCKQLGGGGHARAAGCAIDADLETTKNKLLKVIQPIFQE